jgi:PTH2 family peptidyl-tRNA hydrolase
MNDTKQVIVMRKDLNMRKGKMVAQGAHASLAFLTRQLRDELIHPIDIDGNAYHKVVTSYAAEQWMHHSFVKVCVGVDSEEELLEIYEAAKAAKLEVHLVTDAGLTEFNGIPTKTCLAIGPNYSEDVDKITGYLKLL